MSDTQFIRDLKKLRGVTAFDTETTGVDPWHGARPYAFPFMDEHGQTAYTAWPVDPLTRRVRPVEAERLAMVEWFAQTNREVVCHNAKFDIRMIEQFGINFAGRIQDTMIAIHAIRGPNPNMQLKPLGKRYLMIDDDDERDLKKATMTARRDGKRRGWAIAGDEISKDPLPADYWMVSPQEGGGALVKKYALRDVERTIMLWLLFKDMMDEEGVRVTYDREMQLWPVVYRMESRGVRIRWNFLQEELANTKKTLVETELKLAKMTPEGMNVNSSKQLGDYMFTPKEAGGLGLAIKAKTPTGKPSTEADVLVKYDHPFLTNLVLSRQLTKFIDTYLGAYRDLSVLDDDGLHILHPDWNQCGPITGRFSCRKPNLQNTTSPTGTASLTSFNARGPFGPRPGYVWLMWDYSQLEVRVFADLANEKTMLRAIAEGADIHDRCTNYAWGGKGNPNAIRAGIHSLGMEAHIDQIHVPEAVKEARRKYGWCGSFRCMGKHCSPDQVVERWMADYAYDIVAAEASIGRKNTRAAAKQLLFLKIYGGGVNTASAFFGGSIERARVFIRDYDSAFPAIKLYRKKLEREVRENGCITNPFGRRIPVPPDAPYKAVNYMIQSASTADLTKDRMVAMDDFLLGSGRDAHQVMTIHDEIVVECLAEHVTHKFLLAMKTLLEDHGGRFRVPLPTELAIVRTRWDEKEKYKFVA